MRDNNADDPYTDNVLKNIPDEIRASFTEMQLQALQDALGQVHSRSNHLVYAQIGISFYWARYYLVFLLGKDRRATVQNLLHSRRQQSSKAIQMGFFVLFGWFFIMLAVTVAFLLLYLLKSLLGINIFPDKHLIDFFDF